MRKLEWLFSRLEEAIGLQELFASMHVRERQKEGSLMSAPFMIQSANGALTIDISHAIYAEGTSILGYPPGRGGSEPIQPNQGWQVIPDPLGSGHCLIVSGACNLCIGIAANVPPGGNVTDDATDRGVGLTLLSTGAGQ
jgi:hypothetical protein